MWGLGKPSLTPKSSALLPVRCNPERIPFVASTPITYPRETTDKRRTTTTNSSSLHHHDSVPSRPHSLICTGAEPIHPVHASSQLGRAAVAPQNEVIFQPFWRGLGFRVQVGFVGSNLSSWSKCQKTLEVDPHLGRCIRQLSEKCYCIWRRWGTRWPPGAESAKIRPHVRDHFASYLHIYYFFPVILLTTPLSDFIVTKKNCCHRSEVSGRLCVTVLGIPVEVSSWPH